MLLKANVGNPLGFYEDVDINRLNNSIIRRLLPSSDLTEKVFHSPWVTKWWRRTSKLLARLPFCGEYCYWLMPTVHVDGRAFWMAVPRRLRRLVLDSSTQERITRYAQRTPFCYKDPRFSLTLPYWQPHLPASTVFLVVFREPSKTVTSIRTFDLTIHHPPVQVPEKWCYHYWYTTYQRLLEWSANKDNWVFVNYQDIMNGESLPLIETMTGCQLDASQLTPSLSRSTPSDGPPSLIARKCVALYEVLCQRAKQDLAARTGSPSGPPGIAR
jgi:hypothetical protein